MHAVVSNPLGYFHYLRKGEYPLCSTRGYDPITEPITGLNPPYLAKQEVHVIHVDELIAKKPFVDKLLLVSNSLKITRLTIGILL